MSDTLVEKCYGEKLCPSFDLAINNALECDALTNKIHDTCTTYVNLLIVHK